MGDTTEQNNQEETGGVGVEKAGGGPAFTALAFARLELRRGQTLGLGLRASGS